MDPCVVCAGPMTSAHRRAAKPALLEGIRSNLATVLPEFSLPSSVNGYVCYACTKVPDCAGPALLLHATRIRKHAQVIRYFFMVFLFLGGGGVSSLIFC